MDGELEYYYLCEKKLKREAPALSRLLSDSVVSLQMMLNKYKDYFPTFTDHTVLHSIEVIDFANKLIGENIDSLNADEIYILLMAAYLHDSGMGLSEADYELFRENICMDPELIRNASTPEIIRQYHHELSGEFIKKYAEFFDMPSKEHIHAVVQVSRGHRKTDLFDEAEYPNDFRLPNGNTVSLPYLAALIRLADELDIAADRNLSFLYNVDELEDERAIIEFKRHNAITHLSITETQFIMHIETDEEKVFQSVMEMSEKLQQTLDYCRWVVAERTPYTIRQETIKLLKNH